MERFNLIVNNFNLLLTVLTIAVVLGVILGICAYLTLLERWVAAWVQDRKGPNRVGPKGLLQPIADGLKFLLKEQVVPRHVDKLFYFLGPSIALTTALIAFAVVPFGSTRPTPDLVNRWPELTEQQKTEAAPVARAILGVARQGRDWLKLTEEEREQAIAEARKSSQPAPPVPASVDKPGGGYGSWPQSNDEYAYVLAADRVHAQANNRAAYSASLQEYNSGYQFILAPGLDIGIVFLFALGSLNVYAVILGGWSSNNKYSLLGGLRASAQMISYEIPMGMAILGAALIVGSLNLERIIQWQVDHGWLIFYQPLAAILFTTAVFAECNRLPFDLSECEQELVAGYHTEYSGMKFALFFLGEYTHMITTSFVVMMVFFGGWSLFGLENVFGAGVAGAILKLVIFGVKMVVFVMFYMVVRWTIPRFRFDQLMGLAWKVMIPLTTINVAIVMVVVHLVVMNGWSPLVLWVLLPLGVGLLVAAAYFSLLLPPQTPVGGRPLRATTLTQPVTR
jgi:NADH:ubiquinone oxidoreductase subunit H